MAVGRLRRCRSRPSEHVVIVRQAVRQRAVELGFSLVDQTKIVTAASELARNTIQHGGGGSAAIEVAQRRRAARAAADVRGPGPGHRGHRRWRMSDGYTTGGGLGLGLSGAKRLSNEFEITSAPGEGTRVVITRWK